MSCEINAAHSIIRAVLKKLKLEEGKLITVERWEEIQKTIENANEDFSIYYETIYVEGSTLNASDLVRVKVRWPTEIEKKDDPTLLDLSGLTEKALKDSLEREAGKVQVVYGNALQTLVTMTDKEFDKAYRELPTNMRNDLVSLRTTLQTLDPTDLANGVKGISAFLAEAKVMTEEVYDLIENIDRGVKDNFIVFLELNELVQQFRPLLEDLNPYVTTNPIVGPLVRTALDKINLIERAYLDRAMDYALDVYDTMYSPKRAAAELKLKEQVERLEAMAKTSPKPELFLKKIDEVKAKFEETNPSLEKLRNTLLGNEADLSRLMNMIRASSAIPDVIIGGLSEHVRTQMNNTNRQLQIKRQEYSDALEAWNTSSLVENVQEKDKVFVETWSEFYEKDGEIVEQVLAGLIHEFDSAFDTELSLIRAASKTGKTWDELKLNPFIQPYAHYESLQAWERDFLRTNSSMPYTDYYYQVEDMLDVKVEGKTLREWRSESYEELNRLKNSIKLQGYVPTDDQIREYKRLSKERYKVFSTKNKVEGTPEYNVAKAMQAYYDERKKFVSQEVTDKTRASFERALNNVKRLEEKGNIPEGSTLKWLALNSEQTTSLEFKNEKARILNSLTDIDQKIRLLMGVPTKDKTPWNNLTEITNPYYEDGEVIASMMPENELSMANELYKELLDSSSNDPRLMGLSEDLIKEFKALKMDENLANNDYDMEPSVQNQANLNTASARVANFLKLHGKPLPQEVKTLQKAKNKLYDELNLLETRTVTSDYQGEYNRQLNLFMEQQGENIPTMFTLKGTKFYFKDGKFRRIYLGEDVEVDQATYEQGYKNSFMHQFRQSEWFQDNHIFTKEFYKEGKKLKSRMVYKPTFPWQKSIPNNPKHILKNEPGGGWKESVVKDSFTLNGVTTQIRNLEFKKGDKPTPKSSYKKNQRFTDLKDNERAYYDFIWKNYMLDQEIYPSGFRMGRRLPAIERNSSVLDVAMNLNLDTGSRLLEQAGRKFYSDAQDYDDSYGDNRNRKFLPVYLTGNLDPNLQDYNLHRIFLTYSREAMKYKELQDNSLPLIKATEAVMGNPEYGSSRTMKDANVQKTKRGSNNERILLLREVADMLIYGEHEKKSEGFTVTPDTWIFGKIKSLHGKNFRWEKIFGTLLGARAAGLMMNSFLPQIPNYLNGLFQQLIETAGAKGLANFTFNQWQQAQRETMSTHLVSYAKDMQKTGNKSKFTLMLEYFDAIPGELLDNVGYERDNNGIRKLLSSDIMYLVKNSVEWELAASTFIAFSKNYMINGVSLWDSFEERKGLLEVKEGLEVTPQIIDDISSRVRKLQWEVNGNYAKFDKSLLEKEWYGRAAFFLKKFMVPFFERRIGLRRFSAITGEATEGYWLLGGKTLVNMLQTSVSNFALLRDPRSLSGMMDLYTPEEKDALQKFGVEVMMFTILYVMASLAWDDEDEDRFKDLKKANFMQQMYVYSLLKTRREVETFIFPLNLNELVVNFERSFQETFPIIKQSFDILRRDFDIDEPYFLATYKRDTGEKEKGDTRLYWSLAKLLGRSATKFDPVEGIRAVEAVQR